MNYVCMLCEEIFSSKKKMVSHLEDELEWAREAVINAEDNIDEVQNQLKDLQDNTHG